MLPSLSARVFLVNELLLAKVTITLAGQAGAQLQAVAAKIKVSGPRSACGPSLALDLRGRLLLQLRVFAGALASRWRSKLQVVLAKI